jgi:glutathione peroxidase
MFLQQMGDDMTKTRAIAVKRDVRLGTAGLFALAMVLALMLPMRAWAGYSFKSIDGGTIDLDDFRGHPVLVVNTASLCGFAPQFTDLQALQDTYGSRGLVVLAVSSNDFNQELDTAGEVKAYCTANFDLTIPMTDITHVLGAEAHPFYAMLKADYGFAPRWNFNKVLVGPDGAIVEHWGSNTNPMAKAITGPIEALLK